MKKILIYTMIMTRGGAENTIANIANNLISKYDITIVTNINHSCEYELNDKIKLLFLDEKDKKDESFILKIFTKLSLKRTRKLESVLQEENPDVILSFLPEPNMRALSLKTDIPKIIAIRNHPKKEFKFTKLIRDYYYKKANKIIVQDASYIKYLNRNVQNKIEVLPNFISRSFVEKGVDVKKENIIMTATRLEKQKNLPLLIDAFASLDKKYSDYKLYIYGTGSLKNELENKIKSLKLEKRIVLKGVSKDMKTEYNRAKLFVLPSNYEGMPNVLLEAMACGLPVISTYSTEVLDSIIEDGVNGFIVSKNDSGKLKEKIEYVLKNETIACNIGNNAKKIIKSHSEEEIMKKWESVLEIY